MPTSECIVADAGGKKLSRYRMIVTCVDKTTQRAMPWPVEAAAQFYEEPTT